MIEHPILLAVAAIFMALGIPAVLVPFLPAISYMFLIALLFAISDRFVHITWENLAVLGGILIVSFFIDYFAGILGARYGGADRRSILFGFLGLIVGLIAFPPLGGIVGLFVGIFAGEVVARKSNAAALKAATAGLIGSATGALVNCSLAVLMFGLFLYFVLV
ncbi:MAG: DUF456 domain-containing protein [Patescibacteria group bacterium]